MYGVIVGVLKMKEFMRAKFKNFIAVESLLPGFETHEESWNENKFRVRALSRASGYEARALAEKLSECDDEDPCFSFACHECIRRLRLKKISQLAFFCEDYKEWSVATLIYYDEMVRELGNLDIARLKGRLSKQLHRADIPVVVMGYFEVDYQTEYQHWVPHFHLLVKCRDSYTPEWIRLRKLFQKQEVSNNVNIIRFSPIEVQDLEDKIEQIAYICKFMWQRVESYHNSNGNRVREKYRLPKNKFIDSLLKLNSLKLVDVELMYKVRQFGTTLRESVHGKK